MNCIAIDDEPLALDVIRLHIEKISFATLAATFTDGFKALEYIHSHTVDLIFTDISMPDVSGFQLSKTLNDGPMMIFTTAFSKYAVESYELNAIDYLMKPIEFERFLAATNKAFRIYNDKVNRPERSLRDDFILIKSGTEIHKVALDKILYVESNGNYVSFVTTEATILARYSIQDVLRMLPSERFIRVHRGFVVSFTHIGKMENHQVTVAGKHIPLGDVYRHELFRFLEQHK